MSKATVVQWDLHATDAVAQRRFYSDVFGWVCRFPNDPTQYGWMKTGDGQMLGGIGQATGEETPGVAIFVRLDDVPATMQRARALGGSVLWGPVKHPDGMVRGCIADPHGNAVLLIRPSDEGHPYAFRPRADAGQWEWEIQSHDPAALAPFYEELFGWTFDGVNEWGWGKVDTGVEGGTDGALSTGDAPCTFFIVTVTNLLASVEQVKAHGGRIVVDPWQVSDTLAIAVFMDPENNRVGLRYPGLIANEPLTATAPRRIGRETAH